MLGGGDVIQIVLQPNRGGVLHMPGITSWENVQASIDHDSQLPTSELTSIRRSHVRVDGGTASFANVTDFDGSGAVAAGGTELAFPKVTSYTVADVDSRQLSAVGPGNRLDMSAVSSITASPLGHVLYVVALNGGEVDLSGVRGFSAAADIRLNEGTLDLSELREFSGPAILSIQSHGSLLRVGNLPLSDGGLSITATGGRVEILNDLVLFGTQTSDPGMWSTIVSFVGTGLQRQEVGVRIAVRSLTLPSAILQLVRSSLC